jgi:iron(III) transport system substrate-binding protein
LQRARVVPVILFLLLTVAGCGRPGPRVVVYCAQDQDFAVGIFSAFEQNAGLTVAAHYDTEASKSVALFQELVQEGTRPRCDVFWNNEILSTIRLHRRGLLEPYPSPSAGPYPASARAEDNSWHAFAARARVLLVNTQKLAEADHPKCILDLSDAKYKGQLALAKPHAGTTATHAACLFEVLGADAAKKWFLDLKANDVQLTDGNKAVAVGVGEGRYALGLTDTDDAIIEVKAGRPVKIIFLDRDLATNGRLGTLFIPNTVMLIKGGPNPDAGRKMIDYLLSAEVERRLAEESASHQIPLNPKVSAKLPAQIETPQTVKAMQVDWVKAADLWEEVQAFLRKEFARP